MNASIGYNDVDAGVDADSHVSASEVIDAGRIVWVITVVAVAVCWLIMTSWRPWELFDRAGFSADFYDEQARAFLHGRLAVDPSIPGPEGFVIGGKTYLYYGPFLSVVRLPFMVLGDVFVGRLVRVSILIAMFVVCRGSARLARAGGRLVRSAGIAVGGDERWPVGIFTAAVAFSPALFSAGWVSVYHETELWAFALTIVAIAAMVDWMASEFTDRRALGVAALGAMAVTLTRAPIGLGLCLALCGFGIVMGWRRRHEGWRAAAGAGWPAAAAGLAPAVAHAAVNWAKFSSLLGVPGDRQLLSLQNPERAAWFAGNNGSFFSSRFLTTTMAQYFRPDALRFERLVPGVRFGPLATNRGSYPVESITPATSITASATLLLLLAIAGVVWMLRHRCRSWLLLLAATMLATLPTFAIGFIANRYLIDMLAPLAIGGAVGTWIVHNWPWGRVLRASGVALALWGLWVNASLATWTNEYKSAGFTELRYRIDAALFGEGGSPSLVTLVPGMPVPRDGVVALDPDCAGVYIAEQHRWVALERADGVRTTSGIIDDPMATEVVVAEGRGWRMQLVVDGSMASLVITAEDGVVMSSQPVDLVAAGAAPLSYEVDIDPVTREFLARVGDVDLLLPGELAATGGPITGASDAAESMSSLCLELRRSL